MEADPPLFDECSAGNRTALEDEESAKKRSAVRQTSLEEEFAKRPLKGEDGVAAARNKAGKVA